MIEICKDCTNNDDCQHDQNMVEDCLCHDGYLYEEDKNYKEGSNTHE